MSAPDLSVVIVNWNTRDLLRDCLRSIIGSQSVASLEQNRTTDDWRLTAEIIVVDNGSTDGSIEMLAAEFPDVRVMANQTNRGFASANNQALAIACGRYCLLLNSDTRVAPDALVPIVAFMDAHPRVGACAPQLRNGDGTLQPSGRRFPTLVSAFGELLPLPEWWRRVLRGDLDSHDYSQACPVDEVSGAAVCIRRTALDQVGFLDEDFFFLGEDIDLCWRLKSAGWQVFYLPTAQVTHYWGGSRDKTNAYRISLLAQRSYYLLLRKHRGEWQARTLKVFVILLTFFKLAKWLVLSARRGGAGQAREVARAHLAELTWLWRN